MWDVTKAEDHWLELRDPEGWWKSVAKWDGCIHLAAYGNLPYVEGEKREEPPCCDDYIHICDLDDYIKRLEALRDAAKAHYGADWPDI